ncbi:MAG: hypothetical protein JWP52_1875 [Rhizobacter sp.]|nr:hypothetical protein [Rhizobacter sp.]
MSIQDLNPLNIIGKILDAITPDTPEQSMKKLLEKFKNDKNADPTEMLAEIDKILTETLGKKDVSGRSISAEAEKKHPELVAISKQIEEMEKNDIPPNQMMQALSTSPEDSKNGKVMPPVMQGRDKSVGALTF